MAIIIILKKSHSLFVLMFKESSETFKIAPEKPKFELYFLELLFQQIGPLK